MPFDGLSLEPLIRAALGGRILGHRLYETVPMLRIFKNQFGNANEDCVTHSSADPEGAMLEFSGHGWSKNYLVSHVLVG